MYLELNFQPTVQIITVLRRSVMSLYERVLNDSEASSRIALATHELLENVLRHSVGGETTLQIYTHDTPISAVTIETRNRAEETDIEHLKAQAARMSECDATAYYMDVMEQCAASDDDGGLGLARIRAEAEMTVVVRAEGDCVHIIATTRIGGEVGAAA